MDIKEQIVEIEYCHSDRFEFEWGRVKYSQPLLAQAFYFQADQILAIKVEEDDVCPDCGHEGCPMKKWGRTLKQVLEEL